MDINESESKSESYSLELFGGKCWIFFYDGFLEDIKSLVESCVSVKIVFHCFLEFFVTSLIIS